MKSDSKVAAICKVPSTRNRWIDKLPTAKRRLAEAVRKEVVSKGLPMRPVARNLIDELGLSVSDQPVIAWFKEGAK